MGNSLSPFICNLFVGDLKEKLSTDHLFSKVSHRYVDDIVLLFATLEGMFCKTSKLH